jgi:hypothetical protein
MVDSGVYDCTCKASSKPACVHRAAVYLAKMVGSGAKVVGVKPATRQRRQAAAPTARAESAESAESNRPVALATFRTGGVEYAGTGRKVLDALGNAQAA